MADPEIDIAAMGRAQGALGIRRSSARVCSSASLRFCARRRRACDNRRAPHHVQAGFVWINEVSKHFLGAPFGGYKQSGIGREECFEEMLAYTQEKNIHVKLKPAKA
jgi:hypothetical protein